MDGDLLERLADVFAEAYSCLGPQFAFLEHQRIGSADRPFHLVTLQPTNPMAARIHAALVGPVHITIGRNRNTVDLDDLMESAGEAGPVELTREIVDAVVSGRYHEHIQRLGGSWTVSLTGYLELDGKPVSFGRGFVLPLTKRVHQTYQPYRVEANPNLHLVPEKTHYGPDQWEGLPAFGYAVADATGTKLSREQLDAYGLIRHGIELDEPWKEEIRDPRFDPGRLVTVTPDPDRRPLPRVWVSDAKNELRIGHLGLILGAEDLDRLFGPRSARREAAGIVLLEGIFQEKRTHATVLVGPPALIHRLHQSLPAG